MSPLFLLTDPSDMDAILILSVCSVILLPLIVSGWRIFTKAGRQGWEAYIPVYNVIIALKIVGKPWWWFFLMCIPYLNIVFIVWSLNMLSKSFGKTEGFTAGLYFLSIVFLPILAFGDAVYQGPYGNAAEYEAYQATLNPMFDFEKA